jgi:hypothetical protein
MANEKNSHKGSVLILMAIFGLMVVMSPRPARAQQDVDPTWYNPWTPETPVVAHVVSHANATKTTAEANQGKKTLTAAPATKVKAQTTSTSTQKTAKLSKTTAHADQS